MKNKNIVEIADLDKGFHKVTYENGTIEYVIARKIKELKISKKENKAIEQKDSKDAESKSKELDALKKDDLAEIARRLGFNGEINNSITKAILIDFINKNDK